MVYVGTVHLMSILLPYFDNNSFKGAFYFCVLLHAFYCKTVQAVSGLIFQHFFSYALIKSR